MRNEHLDETKTGGRVLARTLALNVCEIQQEPDVEGAFPTGPTTVVQDRFG